MSAPLPSDRAARAPDSVPLSPDCYPRQPVAAALPSAVDARLSELAAQHQLPPSARGQLASLLGSLEQDDLAPTTVRDPAVAVDRHVADSLTALELPEVRRARAIVDIGSGAGFPGAALACALPRAHVALLESQRRKCDFLARALTAAHLHNAAVVCNRAETWTAGFGRHDLLTARALAPLPVIAEYAAPLLALDGALVAWKGARDEGEERRALVAAAELGLEFRRLLTPDPLPGADQRHLYLYVKVRETPKRFPRRAGIARKRPLGASAGA